MNFKRICCFLLSFVIFAAVSYGKEKSPALANSHPVYKQLRNIKLSGNAVSVNNQKSERCPGENAS